MRKGLFDKKPEPAKVPEPIPIIEIEPETPTIKKYKYEKPAKVEGGGHYWPKHKKSVKE